MSQNKNKCNTFTRKQLILSHFVSEEVPPTFHFSLSQQFQNVVKFSSPICHIPPMHFGISDYTSPLSTILIYTSADVK